MNTMKRHARLWLVLGLLATPLAHAHDGYDKALQAYSCVDYSKALSLFTTYAEQGHGLSQYMVGIMTEQGQGTDVNVDAAFKWYMSAAKQNLTDAYFALADMYRRGISVAKDPIQAYAWYDLAWKGGHKLAQDMVAVLSKELDPQQIAQARKLQVEWLAQLKP